MFCPLRSSIGGIILVFLSHFFVIINHMKMTPFLLFLSHIFYFLMLFFSLYLFSFWQRSIISSLSTSPSSRILLNRLSLSFVLFHWPHFHQETILNLIWQPVVHFRGSLLFFFWSSSKFIPLFKFLTFFCASLLFKFYKINLFKFMLYYTVLAAKLLHTWI